MAFLRDMLPVIFFFLILDTASTILALQVGYEGNPVMSWGITEYGIIYLIIVKVLAIPAFYACYRLQKSRIAWNISRFSVAALGLVISVSNMLVYAYGISLFQWAGVA
jgi:hypothetical protein